MLLNYFGGVLSRYLFHTIKGIIIDKAAIGALLFKYQCEFFIKREVFGQ